MIDKERKNDRVLVLKQIEGKDPKSTTGLVDKRLFTGDNNLHAIKDPSNNLWYIKYDQGGVPPAFKDVRWTTFQALYAAMEVYFKSRNIQIVEVRD